jgi:hypothetical protein
MRTPLFYLSALLLACNDFVWKAQFHNTFTGKLSDFAGIALWVLFWEAWLPKHFRVHLYCLSAIIFTWFKSPLSEGVLQFLHLQRVVDYTDLYALLVLLPLYFFNKKTNFVTWQPTVLASIVALFLFGATSPKEGNCTYYPCQNPKIHYFNISPDSLKTRINLRYPNQYSADAAYVNIGLQPYGCKQGIGYRFILKKIGTDSSSLQLENCLPVCSESYAQDSICIFVESKIIPSLR